MKCRMCGTQMNSIITDLPFKTTDTTIIIIKELPVLQCTNCPEYLLEDAVMARVDQILAGINASAELEIVRFAA
jgi:YgiT-type zinc finger domain-containing protein